MPFWSTRLRFIRGNLVFKILFVVVFTTVTAVVILLAYSTIITRKAILDYAHSIHEVRLQNSATIIDQKLFNLQSDVAGLAAAYTVNNALSNPNSQNQALLKKDLQTTFENTGPWQQIFIADVNNNIVQAVGQNSNQLATLPTTDEYLEFRKLIEENRSISVTTSKDHRAIVNYLQPVKSSANKVIGYVGGTYNLENLKQLINIPRENAIYIVNNLGQANLVLGNGNLVKIDDINRVINQEQVLGKSTVVENDNRQITYLPKFSSGLIAQLQLRLVGVLDQQYILKDIDDFRLRVYIVSAIALVIVNILLILYLSRLIVKPLNELKDVAQKIAAGKYEARVKVSRRTDAIGLLQYALNDMAMSLINEHNNLEKQVEEQTEELSNKVQDLERAKRATVNILDDLSTTKEEVEQAKNKDEALLSSIGDGVMALDTKQNIILFNNAASKITGFSEHEVLGKIYSDVLHFSMKTEPGRKLDFVKKALGGHNSDMPKVTYVRHKSGHLIPVDDSSSPVIENGKVVGAIVVFRDITKELQTDIAKSEFVSLASHQLRTPLTAISWYSEMLQKSQAKSLTPDQRKYVKEIFVGNKRMIELVNALLNISRLELGTVVIEPKQADMAAVLRSVEDEFKHTISLHKQTLKLSIAKDLPIINTDPQLARIVVQNLVSNASKYSPDRGHIELSVKYIKTPIELAGQKIKKDSILISVKDNGYGIPTTEQSKIFKKLYRADNIKAKNTDGTGLGLYMSKLLIEILKGKIWFHSKINKGATFYIQLPLNAKLKKGGSRQLEKTI